MISLASIPEPSNNAPKADADDAAHHPLIDAAPNNHLETTNDPEGQTAPTLDADQQVDSVALLLVLLIAGALLRLVLGLLGPLQGIDPTQAQHAQAHGKQILAGEPNNAYPLFDLLNYGLASAGLPAWSAILLGSILTLASIPAAYIVGQTLTRRHLAGVVAAAIVAVHPAVLTASNSFASPALAIGLITLSLASLCFIERKGAATAFVGGGLLGLAGLVAPMCWLVGILAGPLTYKLARRSGAAKAFVLAVAVTLLAAAPAVTYRAAFFGHDSNALLTEWSSTDTTAPTLAPMQRLLVTMTSPSFKELGEAMHLPLNDAGRLKVTTAAAPAPQGQRDAVADVLADGWLVLNAALAALAAISVGVMIARRRIAETLILALPLLALAFCTLPPSEALRLPMIALVGILATGLFATRSVPRIDEAAQEAKRIKQFEKQEAKERARQERELAKHKDSLYAFDQPAKANKTKQADPPSEPATQAILTEHEEQTPAFGARPI